MSTSFALYPGCTLDGSSGAFLTSFEAVLDTLGVSCATLSDWSCCGASSAHALDHRLHLALNLRNLALAEGQGFDEIVVPCAACYHRLASAAFEFRQGRRVAANALRGDGFGVRRARGGAQRARFPLERGGRAGDYRARDASPRQAKTSLATYGCLNTRIPRMESFDDREYPVSMDRLVEALGARDAGLVRTRRNAAARACF